jgi:hypothetical protein
MPRLGNLQQDAFRSLGARLLLREGDERRAADGPLDDHL